MGLQGCADGVVAGAAPPQLPISTPSGRCCSHCLAQLLPPLARQCADMPLLLLLACRCAMPSLLTLHSHSHSFRSCASTLRTSRRRRPPPSPTASTASSPSPTTRTRSTSHSTRSHFCGTYARRGRQAASSTAGGGEGHWQAFAAGWTSHTKVTSWLRHAMASACTVHPTRSPPPAAPIPSRFQPLQAAACPPPSPHRPDCGPAGTTHRQCTPPHPQTPAYHLRCRFCPSSLPLVPPANTPTSPPTPPLGRPPTVTATAQLLRHEAGGGRHRRRQRAA